MTRFSKAVMQSAAKTINNSLKKGNGYPTSITLKDMDKKKDHKLSKKQYMGLYEAQNVFLLKNGRYPNYTTLVSTASNPLVMDYQNNGYTCGPTSLSMASQLLFNYVSESKCASTLGTVIGSGTDPSKLVANAPKLGFTVTKITRNLASVKKSINKGFPVIAHIDTIKAPCLGYTKNYGHYILIYGYTSDNKYRIADPTKGIKTCASSVIDKAMLNRTINYYQVKPK